jgi:7,8-dihydropterin-6-yl-methyl-4-(beta-D-ribofuranosyl)aminobenzene 5'-phosphate synthase
MARVCTDDSPAGLVPPPVLHDAEPGAEIGLAAVDWVTVTILVDNVADMLMPDQGPARRVTAGSGPRRASGTMAGGELPDGLVAEHGFAALVTVGRAGREHRLLFDTGASPDGVVENMRRLDVDPGSIEAIVCSHGHFDHTGGLDGLRRVLGRAGLPVLIHPHFWRQRRLAVPGREPAEIPATSRRALIEAGFEVIEEARPSFLLDGCVLITGEVARTTGYEPGLPSQQALIGGRWEPDPLVLDDQALIVSVAGKGLLVITGCGHSGVVNIARYAGRLTGGQPLHALLGGFHLSGPAFEPLIPRVLDDLAALEPDWLVPAHCTGWRAQHALAARLPGAFVPSAVGTTIAL